MTRLLFLMILSALGITFASWMTQVSTRGPAQARPVGSAVPTPVHGCLYGAGVIEAWGENRLIGTPLSGIVTTVLVSVGSQVGCGEVLATLDDRQVQAELALDQAAVETAQARLARLRSLPRMEDVVPAQAHLTAAIAAQADAQEHFQRLQGLTRGDTISPDTLAHARHAAEAATAERLQAQALLDSLTAGAWHGDLAVAEAEVIEAQAQVHMAEVHVQLLQIRAPHAGTILTVHVHPGEFASAQSATPLFTMGQTDQLQVRVDIDQDDAWQVSPELKATAFVRGNHDLHVALTFVRIEPQVIPKQSLTGDSTQRVDTRVLQIIYHLTPGEMPVYAGQQLDVVLDGLGCGSGKRPAKPATSPAE